jgi:hypothetical protein
MVRLQESQSNHDSEVCRLARKYANYPIWTSCLTVRSTVTLPKFPYEGINYEPDVFLNQVKPEGENTPVDWIFEVETKDSINDEHTEKQLRAFAAYAQKVPTKIFVLVPKEAIEQMKANLKKWGLSGVIAVVEWGWPP